MVSVITTFARIRGFGSFALLLVAVLANMGVLHVATLIGDSVLGLGVWLVGLIAINIPVLKLLESQERKREELAARRADERGEAGGAYNLGVLLLQRGDLEGAEAAWRRADERGEAAGAYNLGVLLEQRGDLEGAEAAWRRIEGCGDATGEAAAAYNLGVLLEQRGDLEGAEAAWCRADEHQGVKDAVDLGRQLEESGNLEGAEAAYRRAAERGDQRALLYLGLLSPEFTVTEHTVDGGRHVLAVRGEIDYFTAPQLKQALAQSIEHGRIRIIIDLTETTFMDSKAFVVLSGAAERLRSRDGALAVVVVDYSIAKILELTGLDQIFTLAPTRKEAIDALDAARGDFESAQAAWQRGKARRDNGPHGLSLAMSKHDYKHPDELQGMFLPMIPAAYQLHGLAGLRYRAASWGLAARARWDSRRTRDIHEPSH